MTSLPLANDPVRNDCLSGGGQMGALMRAFDWSTTGLGDPSTWPQSLRSAAGICLNSRYPIAIYWGPSFALLYNDAWSPIPGTKHPWALGRPGREVWPEIWDTIGPAFEQVVATGEGVWFEDQLLPMHRHGYTEECYFNYTFSPVRGEDGRVAGVFNAVVETTYRVIGERRTRLLRDLAAKATTGRTAAETCALAAAALRTDPADVPFALLYLVDPDRSTARLASAAGIEPGHRAAPEVVSLNTDLDPAGWPLARVARTGRGEVLAELPASLARLPGGPWAEPPREAVVLPIGIPGQGETAGLLVAGASPRRALDDEYRAFFERVAGNVASAVANARAYEQERRRSEELAELDRAKTLFFSNVSHEFRTPLTLLLGPLEDALATPGGLPPATREALLLAHRSGRRLQKLVNALLDFSRIEAGRVQARYEPVDLGQYTADVAGVFRTAVEKAGIRLSIDCPPLPEPVFIDRDMWEKVISNLVSNAFKYTLEGEIRVSVRAEGGRAILAVQDTGTGIAEAELPHLFDRFHRIEGAAARTHEGTGIGLALVQELVKLHGGQVTASSTLGVGSTFTVAIPLGRDHLPADRICAARTRPPALVEADAFAEEALRWLPGDGDGAPSTDGRSRRQAAPGRPLGRVLLADDNADMREYVGRLLGGSYEVIAVSDGRRALAAALQHPPDLVLADVMMPELDGFGLLRALRTNPSTAGIPVILLSARAGEEAKVEGLGAGADEYLVKPFSSRELLARVGGALSLSRVRREAAEANAKLRAMFEQGTQFAGILSLDGTLVEANRIFLDACGFTRRDVIGKPFWECGWWSPSPELARMVQGAFLEAAAGRVFRTESSYFVADGSVRFVDLTLAPVRDHDGRVLFVAPTGTDITERKRAEEALKAMYESLREADKRKDEFLATLAHELRNPLAPLQHGLSVLGAEGTSERDRKLLGMMERQVVQLVHLVDDLLDVSRVTSGKVTLRTGPLDLRDVVSLALETSRPGIDAAGHGLEVTLPEGPLPLEGDRTRLAQVLTNILNNASKYTPAKGRIALSAERDGGSVVVRVTDTGVGIPADMLVKVFDTFTQVGRSIERAQGGLGLGLALARRLVEMHGGSVWAESPGPGKGSTFSVRLPLAIQAAGGVKVISDTARAQKAGSHRILVVDDNADAAEILAMVLDFAGHPTQIAESGPDALEKARTFRPEVVFLDIGLPGMNGYEVAEAFRADPELAGTVLIALTGWGSEEDRKRGAEAGFDFHLTKPVEPAKIHKLLGRLQRA